MNKLLVVVDPQMDFINGTLPVPGAEFAMKRLADYIAGHGSEYICKVVTADWHPYDHVSFVSEGGQWPVHCVQNSVGAALYPDLIESLYGTEGKVEVLYKGNSRNVEEYSIFANKKSAGLLDGFIKDMNIGNIDICGLAGDICVLNTLKDGISIYGPEMFNVLKDFSPSMDGGKALDEMIKTLIL